MVVMFDVTDPVEREHAMAKHEATPAQLDWKAVLTGDENGFRALLQTVVQEVLEAEMTEALQAEKNERTASRLGHRSGYYERKLVTRIGVLELRVPQDRAGRFSTELFERYQRSEKALVAALAEMYVQGVSTRKVKAVTEELCGHSFSASAISDATARLDGTLKAFAERRLDEPYPYLILDARYERVREAGVIRSQAVLIAIGVDWEGRRPFGRLRVRGARRRARQSREPLELARLPRGPQGARSRRRRARGVGRPSGAQGGDPRGAARGRLAALLRAFPPECAGLCAAQGRRRLPDGAALVRSLSSGRRSRTRGIGAILPRCAATSPPGSPSGRRSIPS
jgi:hypothetical protein